MRGLNAFMDLPAGRNDVLQGGEQVRRGEVEFRNVSFSYPKAGEKALDNVTIKISPGE